MNLEEEEEYEKIGEQEAVLTTTETTPENTKLKELEMMKSVLEMQHSHFCNREIRRKHKKQYNLYKAVCGLIDYEKKHGDKNEE